MDLRLGRWQDALADVGMVDAVITDPPYGERTHSKQFHGRRKTAVGNWATSVGLGYTHWTADDVAEFVAGWADRCSGWFCAMTSHDLVPAWEDAFRAAGRYVFAPLPIVLRGMNVRLAGDGPSSWCVWMMVSRPTGYKDGTKPGAYVGNPSDRAQYGNPQLVVGGKPLWLMKTIIRDYTKPGDLVCDPCMGGGTTLLAAAMEGRRAIGAEMDPDTHAKAVARLAKGYTKPMFLDGTKAKQGDLL